METAMAGVLPTVGIKSCFVMFFPNVVLLMLCSGYPMIHFKRHILPLHSIHRNKLTPNIHVVAVDGFITELETKII